MTRDDIIRMAREAGLGHLPDNWGDGWWQADRTEVIERFAALVAAAEREACAKVCESMKPGKHAGAKLWPEDFANAIRARGNHD